MSVRAEESRADERFWLSRAVTVLASPRDVFGALRDDSDTAARARSEAVLALVFLSGIASVLWTPNYGRLMDDVSMDGLLVAVIAFIAGGIYGTAVYYVGGLLLHWVTRAVGGTTLRQARHVLASLLPLVDRATLGTSLRSPRLRSLFRCSPSGPSGLRSTARTSSAAGAPIMARATRPSR